MLDTYGLPQSLPQSSLICGKEEEEEEEKLRDGEKEKEDRGNYDLQKDEVEQEGKGKEHWGKKGKILKKEEVEGWRGGK